MVGTIFDPRFIQCNKAVSLLGLMQTDKHSKIGLLERMWEEIWLVKGGHCCSANLK